MPSVGRQNSNFDMRFQAFFGTMGEQVKIPSTLQKLRSRPAVCETFGDHAEFFSSIAPIGRVVKVRGRGHVAFLCEEMPLRI